MDAVHNSTSNDIQILQNTQPSCHDPIEKHTEVCKYREKREEEEEENCKYKQDTSFNWKYKYLVGVLNFQCKKLSIEYNYPIISRVSSHSNF